MTTNEFCLQICGYKKTIAITKNLLKLNIRWIVDRPTYIQVLHTYMNVLRTTKESSMITVRVHHFHYNMQTCKGAF